MRPFIVILAVVATIAAGLAAFLSKRWLDGQAAGGAAAAAGVTDVLVVVREVPAGAALQDADLRYEAWPARSVTPRMLVRRDGEDPKARIVGQVTRRALAEGEPFSHGAVFKSDGAGVLAGMLAPGMRAVSVAITPASAVSGFIVPGDRVDVVMGADFRKADAPQAGKGEPIVRFAAETVLEDVRVIAIDQQIARGRDGATIQGKTATVEVTPKQSEVLVAAGMMGQLSLVLRSLGNAPAGSELDRGAPKDFTADVDASRAMRALAGGGSAAPPARSGGGGGPSVQINRGGALSTKSF